MYPLSKIIASKYLNEMFSYSAGEMKQYENLLYTAYFVQITVCNKIVVLTAAKTRVSKCKSPKNASAKANNAVCFFGHQTTIKYSEISDAKMIVQNYFFRNTH